MLQGACAHGSVCGSTRGGQGGGCCDRAGTGCVWEEGADVCELADQACAAAAAEEDRAVKRQLVWWHCL